MEIKRDIKGMPVDQVRKLVGSSQSVEVHQMDDFSVDRHLGMLARIESIEADIYVKKLGLPIMQRLLDKHLFQLRIRAGSNPLLLELTRYMERRINPKLIE